MKLLLIFAVAASLFATAVVSEAALGWTLNESVQHYGGPVRGRCSIRTGSGEHFIFSKSKAVLLAHFILTERSPAWSTLKRRPWKTQFSRLTCLITLPRWFGFRLWTQSENGWVAQANCKSNVGLNLMPAED